MLNQTVSINFDLSSGSRDGRIIVAEKEVAMSTK